MRNYLELGKWNVICDRCGFKYKNTDLRKEWTGLMVCCNCFETRHPQDLLQVRAETLFPNYTRPEPTDVFVDTLDPWMTEAGIPIYAEPVELPLYT